MKDIRHYASKAFDVLMAIAMIAFCLNTATCFTGKCYIASDTSRDYSWSGR